MTDRDTKGQESDDEAETDDDDLDADNELETARELATRVAGALIGLPILERLKFAKHLLFDRGGDKDEAGFDPHAVLLVQILDDVMEVLEEHPRIAKIRVPNGSAQAGRVLKALAARGASSQAKQGLDPERPF